MQKQNVEQIIKELARENFRLYPESYANKNENDSDYYRNNLSELAAGYWRERNEHEIKRDSELEIDIQDYENWVWEAFDSFENNPFLKGDSEKIWAQLEENARPISKEKLKNIRLKKQSGRK